MTILTLSKKELEKKVGKITKETENKIDLMGTPIEEVTDSEVSIEIFPNRPDLLSLQGFARSLSQHLGKKSVVNFKVNPPEEKYKVKIDKSVKQVRPYTACAIIKKLKLDDEKIKEIIDIQEKLHITLGRKRKKLAIGIYPLEKIKLPITYLAKKPEDIKFIPLESQKEMTGKQILRQHPAGRDYANLLQDFEMYPIFVDANEKILSMPPIINSHETGKINKDTKDIFIECSGFNLAYLKKTIAILTTALSDMGGKIYAMEIQNGKESFISPNLEPEEIPFKIKDIEKTLGLKFNEKEIKNYLGKMGIDLKKNKDNLTALIPAYRADILHWIDLTEEIAIAYGYDKIEPELPKISTIAEENKISKIKRMIAEIISGLGLLECSSFHLAKKNDIKKMHYDFKEFIDIEKSKTEYNVLRIDIMSNLLKIFSENSNSAYPQKIFEMGKSFSKNENSETGVIETEKLAIAIADEKVNFTNLKMILDYLFKMLNKEYELEEVEDNNYIAGRIGKIIVDKKEIGKIGEIAPRVLKNWKIKVPVAGIELKLNFLF